MTDRRDVADASPVLRLTRTLAARREVVFEAFSHADALRVWFCPPDFTCLLAEADFRVGGRYRVDVRSPQGQVSRVGGVYHDICRPARLVFSWRLESGHDLAGHETLITVELHDTGNKTQLIMTHVNLPAVLRRDEYEWGMSGALDKLQILVEQNQQQMARP